MNLIRPNCRDQFSSEDIDFILETLGTADDREVLHDLLVDPEMRDLILDQDQLRDAILEHPQFLKISPHLYFYVLVRETLQRAGIDDRELTDYVAEVVADFSSSETRRKSLPDNVKDSSYLFEMIAALQEASCKAAIISKR